MTNVFGGLISLSAVLTSVFLVAQRHSVIKRSGGWAVVAPLGTLAVGANAVVIFIPADGPRSQALAVVAACFVIAGALATRWSNIPGGLNRLQRQAWWTLAALLAWCFFSDALVDGGIYGTNRWYTYIAAAAVWLGIGLLASLGTLHPAGYAYVGASVLSMMTVTAASDDSHWAPCTTGTFEKCTVAGALYKSFAASENYIAILAAFTLVAALTALQGRERLVVALHASLVLIASGSRTGAASVAISVGCVLVLKAILGRQQQPRARHARALPLPLIALGVAAAVGVAAHLVLTASPGALSRRGAIWEAVRRPLEEHPFTGVGLSKWAWYQEFGESSLHFFHSGYAMLLFSGGFVACALFGLWIFLMIASTNRNEHQMAVIALAALLAIYSVTEVIWNPLAVDGLSWIVAGLASIALQNEKPVPAHLPSNQLRVRRE